MKKIFGNFFVVLLTYLLASFSVFANDIAYNWTIPTLRTDGVAISGVKSYVINVSPTSAFTTTTEIKTSLLTATVTGLTPGKYYARIATIEDGRQGPWSPTTETVVPVPPALPAAPGSLKGTVITINVNIGMQ